MKGAKSCPECGADWQKVSKEAGILSDAGYLHRDVTHLCTECGETWLHGKPKGKWRNPDLDCPVCGGVLQYHKRDVDRTGPDCLHWKCPTCFYWTDRQLDVEMDNGERVAGYPRITGDLDEEADNA